jgi:hypothetical protein
VPVKDQNGQVLALIQALNKHKQKLDPTGFASDTPQLGPAGTHHYWKESDVIAEEKQYMLQRGNPNSKYVLAGAQPPQYAQSQLQQQSQAHAGGGGGAVVMGGGGEDAASIEPFSEEDEEILDAFCVEVRAVIRRHQTDAIIEHSTSNALTGGRGKSDVALSLIEMYNTQTKSKVGAQQFVWPIVNLEVRPAHTPSVAAPRHSFCPSRRFIAIFFFFFWFVVLLLVPFAVALCVYRRAKSPN